MEPIIMTENYEVNGENVRMTIAGNAARFTGEFVHAGITWHSESDTGILNLTTRHAGRAHTLVGEYWLHKGIIWTLDGEFVHAELDSLIQEVVHWANTILMSAPAVRTAAHSAIQ